MFTLRRLIQSTLPSWSVRSSRGERKEKAKGAEQAAGVDWES